MSPAIHFIRSPIPDTYAGKVADILSEHVRARLEAAPENATREEFWRGLKRADFLYHASSSDDLEYRFQGALGFGGKFRNHGYGWRVDCYSEDETPERLAMIESANAALAELYVQFVTELFAAQAQVPAPTPKEEG